MVKDHMKHVTIVVLAIGIALSLPQVRQALAQTTPLCPAGYTCTQNPQQPDGCPAGYTCTVTNPPTTPSRPTTDAYANISTSSLILSYNSNAKESSLTANFTFNVYGGTNGINVYKNGAGVQFIDQSGSVQNLNEQISTITVASSTISTGQDIYGNPYYIVQPRQTLTFKLTTSVNPQQMFAGAYHAVLSAILVNNGNTVNQEFDLQLATNQTYVVAIAGEISPYVTSVSASSGTITQGQTAIISGQRMSNSAIYIDGAALTAGVRGGTTAMAFVVPSTLASGQHLLYVNDPSTGQSNTVAFQVGSGSATVNPPVTTSGSCPNSNLTQCAAVKNLYETLLYREPEQQGWDYWVNTNLSIDQVRQGMMAGVEYNTKQSIISIFQSVLGRNPSNDEINTWYLKAEQNGYNTSIVRTGLGGGTVNTPITTTTVTPLPPTPSVSTPTTSAGTTTASQPVQNTRTLTVIQPPQATANAALFTQLLHRAPDTAAYAYYATMSTDQARIIITQGIEYTTKQKIITVFNNILHRAPTDAELNSWYLIAEQNGYNVTVVQAGLTVATTTPQTSSVWNAVQAFFGN